MITPNAAITYWRRLLYRDFEEEFKNLEPFHPPGDLARLTASAQAQGQTPPSYVEHELLHVMIESPRLSSRYLTTHRYQQLTIMTQQGIPQVGFRDDVLLQGWHHSSAPPAEAPPAPTTT